MSLPDTQPLPLRPGPPEDGPLDELDLQEPRTAGPGDGSGDGPCGGPGPGPTGPGTPAGPPGPRPGSEGPDPGPEPRRPSGTDGGSASVLDGRWARDSQATRLLCAGTHLHGEYAENVASALLDPSFTAIAPSWGLDPVALAQHAKLACDRRRERDRSLRYLLAGMIIVPVTVVVLALTAGLSPFSVALSIVLVTAGGFAAAWMIVFAHYELIRVSSLEAMDARLAPRDTAPALDQATRQRLEELAEGNVVIFGEYRPFVGCGVTVDSWTVCFDVGDTGAGSSALAPAARDRSPAFDPLALQDHLLRTVPAQTPDGLWAESRLFVAGTTARSVPGLIPELIPGRRDQDTWPANRLPQAVLDRFARAPSEAARTYTCLAQPAWRGEIVVSMLIRAELAGTRLFVEGRTHALLPVRTLFNEVKYVPKHPRRAWTAVARSSTAVVVPLLFGSYRRMIDRARAGHHFRRNRERLRKDLIEGTPFNYGATSSLREDVADPAALKYYAAIDEVCSFRVLKRQVLATIESFLDGIGIDTAEFHRQAERAISETTVHLHDLDDADDAFGPKNTVTTRDRIREPG